MYIISCHFPHNQDVWWTILALKTLLLSILQFFYQIVSCDSDFLVIFWNLFSHLIEPILNNALLTFKRLILDYSKYILWLSMLLKFTSQKAVHGWYLRCNKERLPLASNHSEPLWSVVGSGQWASDNWITAWAKFRLVLFTKNKRL